MSDDTGSLVGSNITAETSTFTGAFSYDSSSAPTGQSANAAIYPSGPFEITIDGTHVFQAPVPLTFRIQNDDVNFFDTFEFFTTGGAVLPFPYNPNDEFIRVSVRDATDSVFSDTSLPTNLNLADFSTRELFIRTDLDRAAGQLWIVSGQITSLSTTVPEPASALLLAFATVALAGARRLGRSAV